MVRESHLDSRDMVELARRKFTAVRDVGEDKRELHFPECFVVFPRGADSLRRERKQGMLTMKAETN